MHGACGRRVNSRVQGVLLRAAALVEELLLLLGAQAVVAGLLQLVEDLPDFLLAFALACVVVIVLGMLAIVDLHLRTLPASRGGPPDGQVEQAVDPVRRVGAVLERACEPESGKGTAQVGDVSARIVGRDEQQVRHHQDEREVLEADASEEQQVHPVFGFAHCRGYGNRQHRRRRPDEQRTLHRRAEVGEHVVGEDVERRPAKPAQQVDPPEVLLREEVQEQLPEPVEPQHVEQQVEHVGVHEHVRHHRPRLPHEAPHVGRALQPRQQGGVRLCELHHDVDDSRDEEHPHVDVDEAERDVPLAELHAQVSKYSSHCGIFYASRQSAGSRRACLPGGRSAPPRRSPASPSAAR